MEALSQGKWMLRQQEGEVEDRNSRKLSCYFLCAALKQSLAIINGCVNNKVLISGNYENVIIT
jgi:hypothetical protein